MNQGQGLPVPGSAFPEELVMRLWGWYSGPAAKARLERFPPASPQQLRSLIYPAFQASLQSEESRPVKFRVLLDSRRVLSTVRFDKPVEYTASNLTKLSPTIGIGHRLLVVAPTERDEHALEIIGIWDPDLNPHNEVSKLPQWAIGLITGAENYPGITVTVYGPGTIRVQTDGRPGSDELRNCNIASPYSPNEIDFVREWYSEAGKPFSAFPNPVGASMKSGIVRRSWMSILNKVCNARHGGCFLIVPSGQDVSQFATIKYQLDSNRLQEAMRTRLSFEPSLLSYIPGQTNVDPAIPHQGHFAEREVARTCDLVASLASVDGSVVMQRDLRIVGFGAEILNTAAPSAEEMVKCQDHPLGNPTGRPLNRFGMRHRSAHRFCEGVRMAIAFVISQDGDLRIFDSIEGSIRLHERVTPDESHTFTM